MQFEVLKAKIHGATITEANLAYMGSVTIDKRLLNATGLKKWQKVTIANFSNGYRWDTYIIEGKEGSGVLCINGVSARFNQPGDKVIILAYCCIDETEYEQHQPVIIFPNAKNLINE